MDIDPPKTGLSGSVNSLSEVYGPEHGGRSSTRENCTSASPATTVSDNSDIRLSMEISDDTETLEYRTGIYSPTVTEEWSTQTERTVPIEQEIGWLSVVGKQPTGATLLLENLGVNSCPRAPTKAPNPRIRRTVESPLGFDQVPPTHIKSPQPVRPVQITANELARIEQQVADRLQLGRFKAMAERIERLELDRDRLERESRKRVISEVSTSSGSYSSTQPFDVISIF